MGTKWNLTADVVPPPNCLCDVITESGNQTRLIFDHNLWFLPDRSMYVYYTPKFWRPVS